MSFMCSKTLGRTVHSHLRQESPFPLSGLARDSNPLEKYSCQTAEPVFSKDVGSRVMGNAQTNDQQCAGGLLCHAGRYGDSDPRQLKVSTNQR